MMKLKTSTVALTTAVAVIAIVGSATATATLERRQLWTPALNFDGQRQATPCDLTAVGDWKLDRDGKPWRAVQVSFSGYGAGGIQSVSHTKLFTDASCSEPLDVGPAPDADSLSAPVDSAPPRNAFNPDILRSASWVIREIQTQRPVLETWDPRKVLALNSAKYEAWPIAAHLHSYSRKA